MSNKLKFLPLALFSIPFVYLSLLLDVYFQSVIGFLISLVLTITLGFYFKASNQLPLWFLGNILSTILSFYLQFKHPEWRFFYQPFNPAWLVLGLSILYIIPQLFGIFWATVLKIRLFPKKEKLQKKTHS
ncbi:hypothetical protein P7G51_01870 [Enterococcus asini]|uniref:hypothetical protein n=1 Tax=Enterococcus TaxID=1350 RepID=UPI00288D1A7F|nr:hypothetical protein [Enterococcus asini]MDT2756134.1 hypothetical protein [Enterococcus asini]